MEINSLEHIERNSSDCEIYVNEKGSIIHQNKKKFEHILKRVQHQMHIYQPEGHIYDDSHFYITANWYYQ